MAKQIEAETRFDALVAKGVVEGAILTVWGIAYYKAHAYGTEKGGDKAMVYGNPGSTPEESLQLLRTSVASEPDFKVESICVYQCLRHWIYQGGI